VRKPDGRFPEVTSHPPRTITLNGVDVNALRGETLENVTVRIDEQGNVAIMAPHYEVSTDATFHPLLPTELPRVPKARTAPRDLPQGRFSKDLRGSDGGLGRREPWSPAPRPGAPARTPEARVEVLPESGDASGVDDAFPLPADDGGVAPASGRTLRMNDGPTGDAPEAMGAKAIPPR
jgi:hypothetical protein